MLQAGVKLVLYRSRRDIRISLTQFLNESARGLILRIYLANERFLAGEFEKLLKLFVDYLRKVESIQVSVDQTRTEHGQIIEFYSKEGSVTTDDLSGLFEKFSHFLQLCSIDMQQAIDLLGPTTIPKNEVNDLLSRYAKEARRLLLDIQQEKERKLLAIRHRLQAEIVDEELLSEQAAALTSDMVPTSPIPSNELDLMGIAGFASGGITIMHNPAITINNPKVIARASGIIAQELNGDIHYEEQDIQLLNYIRSNSQPAEYAELKGCLDQIKDKSVQEPQRTTSWQKLKGFLAKHSGRIGDVGYKLLEKWLEKQMFGV
jgi:hypothetical protein